MAYLSLLFDNEKTRGEFYKRTCEEKAIAVVKDIGLTAVLDEIRKSTPDFPNEYLLFPPYDIDTQNLRRETAEEIYNSSALFDSLKNFATKLYVLKQHRRNIAEIKNKDARNQLFLSAVVEYCASLKHLAKITENAHACGLRTICSEAKRLFCEIEHGIYRKAEELCRRVNAILAVSMRFDFYNQTVKIEPAAEDSFSEKLTELAGDVFGTKLSFSFSAVFRKSAEICS